MKNQVLSVLNASQGRCSVDPRLPRQFHLLSYRQRLDILQEVPCEQFTPAESKLIKGRTLHEGVRPACNL